jgi:hypothetical protein
MVSLWSFVAQIFCAFWGTYFAWELWDSIFNRRDSRKGTDIYGAMCTVISFWVFGLAGAVIGAYLEYFLVDYLI